MKKLFILSTALTVILVTSVFADTKSDSPTMQEILKIHRYEDTIDRDINSAAFYSMALIYTPKVFAQDGSNRYSGMVGVVLTVGCGFVYQHLDKGLFEKGYDSYMKKIKPDMGDKDKDQIAYSELKLIADQHKNIRLTGALALAGLGGLMAASNLKPRHDTSEGSDNTEYVRLSGYGFMLWGLYEAIWGTTLFEDMITKHEANKASDKLKVSLIPGLGSIGLSGGYSF
ncbi:MAG TPA: hypothetical protein DF296_09970 [Candidatus Margulisbacteria bacterium]|nr:MAG: hypothetical protein A2X43_11610 [Candidatus Margulisbacteria bacterium GWD2_39_127]OGI04062.1 MAG: hypothetical protein A2X42_11160 [Candidatus Margulisbacteria bacterium GWF2_38_17]OGI06005.1 MAG: hypothetical protein A2X41_12335 [Candidatus Margulisbacteria bacterium GWE2_39_32]HAR63772.1 hypothetical protein [Candidatus Margulisiibacteriota bacterium]HCT85513.1 hypothetical protein [Candidatus Margulisiibacteriota bacterium]